MGKKRGQQCVYCGSEESLTIDHVVPIAYWKEYGVKRRILDNKSNKVTACLKCNREKAGMSPKDWFEKHPEYKERFIRQAKYISNTIKQIAGLE